VPRYRLEHDFFLRLGSQLAHISPCWQSRDHWALEVAVVLVAASGGALSLAGVVEASSVGRWRVRLLLGGSGFRSCCGQACAVGHDVGDGVGGGLRRVEVDRVLGHAVGVGGDAEVEVGLRAGDGSAEVVVGVPFGEVASRPLHPK